jgi:hypothetical protein
MNTKMQVLFVKQTAHVLAVFTRTADPEGKPRVSDLTGSGLSVRNRKPISPASTTGGEILVVPPDALDVAVVDFDPDVFTAPIGFVVGGGRVARLGSGMIKLDPGKPPLPPPAGPPAPKTPPIVNFSAMRVTVVIEGDTTDDKGICVVLQEAQPPAGNEAERRVAKGVITSGTHFVSLDLKTSPDGANASIPKTDFFILALVAGYQPLFDKGVPAS